VQRVIAIILLLAMLPGPVMGWIGYDCTCASCGEGGTSMAQTDREAAPSGCCALSASTPDRDRDSDRSEHEPSPGCDGTMSCCHVVVTAAAPVLTAALPCTAARDQYTLTSDEARPAPHIDTLKRPPRPIIG